MPAARYTRLWMIAALACVVALVYWPSTLFVYEKWIDADSKTYTHGWLILLVCIALVFRSRRELAGVPAHPSRAALLALACVSAIWLLFYRGSIESLEVSLQPLIFWLAITAAFGWYIGRLMLFPVAYFYFAVPVWDVINMPLQHLTVLAMRGALALTGPPALISGEVIHIPNGIFLIEGGCSGLHFMIVGLAVAALYGEQRHDPWRVRVRQLTLMAGLALLANWIRVFTVIQAGYLTDMQSYLVRVSHYGFGWCVFAVALLVFFWLAPMLEPPAAESTGAESAGAAPLPERESAGRIQLAAFVATVATLVALPALSAAVRLAHPAPPAGTVGPLDPRGDWRAVPVDIRSAWLPVFAEADELKRQAFGNNAGATVEVLTVAYRTQRQGAELVGETSSIFGDDLQPLTERVVSDAAGAFREAEVVDRNDNLSLLWWRYQVAGRTLVRPFIQQLWYGLNATVWDPPSGLVALRTVCGEDCSSARGTLRQFVAESDVVRNNR